MSFLPSCQLICTAAQLIWTHHCNGPERLPQFDLSYVKFPGVYLNLCQFYHHVSWFVQLHSCTAELTTGFALKNLSNLTFDMWNSLVCTSIYGNFTIMSADLYRWSADLSSLTADLTPPSDLYRKSNPHWCLTCCSLTSTGPKNYQTIPNQLKIEIWTENINLNNFYPWQHHDFWPYFRVTKSDFRFLKFFQFSRARLKKKFSWAKTLGHCELKSRISGS